MTKRLPLPLVGILLAVAATPASGGRGALTISVRPRVVPSAISSHYGGLEVAGTLAGGAAGRSVTVEANECTYPGWRHVATVPTDPGGAWRVRFDANSSVGRTKTTFRASWHGTKSRTVVVQTRPGVELEQRRGGRWAVGMLAERSFLDRVGQLQRYDRSRGRWALVKRFTFSEKFAVPPGAGGFGGAWTNAYLRAKVARGTQLRAYVPRAQLRPCYLAGYSPITTAR